MAVKGEPGEENKETKRLSTWTIVMRGKITTGCIKKITDRKRIIQMTKTKLIINSRRKKLFNKQS